MHTLTFHSIAILSHTVCTVHNTLYTYVSLLCICNTCMSKFQCIVHTVLYSHFLTGEMSFENKLRSFVVRCAISHLSVPTTSYMFSELISLSLSSRKNVPKHFVVKVDIFVCRGALEYRNLVLLWKCVH